MVSYTPWINELAIGVGYFLAFGALIVFYFGPKAYLLFSGADLNSHFEIVRRGRSLEEMSVERRNKKKIFAAASDDEDLRVQKTLKTASTAVSNATISKYFSQVPDNKNDANLIIFFLQNLVMKMTVLDTADMSVETVDQSDRIEHPAAVASEAGVLASVRVDLGKMLSMKRRSIQIYTPDKETNDGTVNDGTGNS